MELRPEEKLMYKVMKAIYESNVPIDFKGSMVLRACLMQAGYTDAIRHTEDIDANSRNLPIRLPACRELLQKRLSKKENILMMSVYAKKSPLFYTIQIWYIETIGFYS